MQKSTLITACAGLLLAGAVTALVPRAPQDFERLDPAAIAAGPSPIWDVIYARPFRLAQPYRHNWRAERPPVHAGHLLVLAVDPTAFVPSQDYEPVLYVGDQTAERVNRGHPDGALVVIVPSPAGDDGWPTRNLAGLPIFLGGAALPEEVDASSIAAELSLTSAVPFAQARLAQALKNGGAPFDGLDQVDLQQAAATLVLRYAPSERDLAEGMLVPYRR